MWSFRGGPWDGFVIEYGEGAGPDRLVHPRVPCQAEGGRYLLNDEARAYVWTNGLPAGARVIIGGAA
jgi:hypothetical protein